jgi:hypothetical protein
MIERPAPDFSVDDYGPMAGISPLNADALRWLNRFQAKAWGRRTHELGPQLIFHVNDSEQSDVFHDILAAAKARGFNIAF